MLDRITLYHVDSGDLLPETARTVDAVRAIAPHFVTVRGDVHAWIERNGPPSDLVPHSSDVLGQEMGEGRRLSSRYECCSQNLMLPLWDAIKRDGNTLCIRGTKRADMRRLPMRDGQTLDGVELWLPLLDWSHADVLAYLRAERAPLSSLYEHYVNSPECASCSAWWSEGRAAYLRERHPRRFALYRERMAAVMEEVGPVAQNLAAELRELARCTPVGVTGQGIGRMAHSPEQARTAGAQAWCGVPSPPQPAL